MSFAHRGPGEPRYPNWTQTWRRVYDAFKGQPPGFFMTNADLETLTESPLKRAQAALRRARIDLLRDTKRPLISEPGRGYRVGESKEHADLALRKHRQMRRRGREGVALTLHIRTDELTDQKDLTHLEQTQKLLVLSAGFVEQVVKLRKALPAPKRLSLPTVRDMLRVIDGTRRTPKVKTA